MKILDVLNLTLVESLAFIKNGELSAQTYAEAVIAAAERHGNLNTYTEFAGDALRSAAIAADAAQQRGDTLGSLHGVPVILKDNINTQKLPTSGGTPGLRNNRPGVDALVAARLFAAGALLAGKANMHELSSGGTSNNHVFGAVANPYDPARVPGGSSGGTAAAVAARLVPAGLGTDTAGSVRVPAALCGVVGLRPSSGRYPSRGIVPLSHSFDTAGPIARSVADVALLDSVITGDARPVMAPLAKLRLGVPYDSHIETASEAVATVVEAALQRLQRAGVMVVPVDLAEIRALTTAAASSVIDYEFPEDIAAYLEAYAPHLSLAQLADEIASPAVRKLTRERMQRYRDPAAYRKAREIHLPRLREAHAALQRTLGIDALAFPTTADVALLRGDDDNILRNGVPEFSWFYFSNTSMASIAGNPSLTLPVGLATEGLPVGLSLDGLPGADRRLLGVGQALEDELGVLPAPNLAP